MDGQFQQLVDSSPDAVLILDMKGRIRHANRAAVALFGYDSDGLQHEDLQRPFPDQPLRLVAGDGAVSRLELMGRRSDSSQFPAEVTVIPITSSHGAVAVVQVRDLTEERRAQAVLERTLEVLFAANRDRELLLEHLVRVQEDERKRIAAGVHDDTIQVISAAHLRVQQLRNRLLEPAEVAIVDKLDEVLQLSLDRLRELIFDLRPSGLEDGSLAVALRNHLEGMRSLTGTAYVLEVELASTVPSSTSMLIYRTAQEALRNVRKHARATTVRVQLADVDNGYLVRVTDDGVGYDPADVEDRPGHLGLVLMRERPQLAGGWSRIESAPGAGTTVEFWIPADQDDQAETAV